MNKCDLVLRWFETKKTCFCVITRSAIFNNKLYISRFSDPIDEMGSRSSLSRDDLADMDHWEMNYHEAAIFLEASINQNI